MQFRRSGYGAMQLAGPFAGAGRRRPELKRGNTMTSPPPGVPAAAGSQGQDMVAASTVCQVSPTRCQARTRLYRDGRLELEGFPIADISDYLADVSVPACRARRDPDPDALAVLSEESGLHPLAVEAALHRSQRPKLDRYRSHLFLTAYT